MIFTHDSGRQLRRPVFWDGGTTYRVRFASTQPEGEWQWSIHTDQADHDFTPASGTLLAGPPVQDHPHRALSRGFVRAHPQAAVSGTATGRPHSLSSTPLGQCPSVQRFPTSRRTPSDRQAKGFNAVFLMSVQPDMNARGPVGRNVDEGFEIGFHDLAEGRLTKINIEYFQYFDKIIDSLVDHGITPVLQPVFHGFGWKGLDVAGPVVSARGVRPLLPLSRGALTALARRSTCPCGDGSGPSHRLRPAAGEIQAWDAYGQPTGIHYRPHHRNDEHQDAEWLDFQSCQTGHVGDHVPDRLATMWAQRPPKAIMNGEPSYEHSGRHGVAEGWWQGHEAWSNLCAGALMGVAYGAASLWPWRLHPDEPGHGAYFLPRTPAGKKHSISRAAGMSDWSARSWMIYRSPSKPLLGRVRQHPRLARSGRPLHRICGARRALDVLRCRRPGALEVLADRSAYRRSAQVRGSPAELCAHRVRPLRAVGLDLRGKDAGVGEATGPADRR